MIFYFSGTGNSLFVAKQIAKHNKENLISIAAILNGQEKKYEFTLKEGEIIGVVYPVYAWAPPKMVLEFIEKIKFTNFKNHYVFTIATCGGSIGNTIKVFEEQLQKKNIPLKSGFSIKMPNNYIVMGDVDSKEIEKNKLLGAEQAIREINQVIEEKKEGVFKLEKGKLPGLLTALVNPMFNKNALNTKKFYANENCTGCGLCEKVCNCQSIKVQGKPIWGEKCAQCLACINLCPTKAIQLGKGTEKKGRYKNPSIRIDEMKIL